MSTPRIPPPALLVISVLAAEWETFEAEVLEPLVARFGELLHMSEPMAFSETSYYDEELGSPLSRRLLAFYTLQPMDCLPEVKTWCNELEAALARPDGNRIFNLDPGLLTLERLVLATGKNFTHRIYLGQGIWGDLTLIFTKGDWLSFPWTFDDYASASMLDLLTKLREQYKDRLRDMGLFPVPRP
ncbi:MAG: DUF4416 family protein [Desulfovibrio sp.]|nr:MAG: DUF4416 family protein [Desulfovibrio sp.]